MLVQLHDIHLSFPDKVVLGGVSLAIHRGDKFALVGENGAGKTCLLHIILGRLVPDAGHLAIASGTRVGSLDQTALDTDLAVRTATCFDVALEPFAGLRALEQEIERVSSALADAGPDAASQLLDAFGDAQHRYEAAGGFTYRSRTAASLNGLGLARNVWGIPVGSLSAGQKVRLALARLLLGEHDLLLLDEPTNHLDLAGREWLEDYLARLSIAYVVVSHDRRFLDGVAAKVAHLERGRLTTYIGNYSAFRSQVEQALETARRTYEKRQKIVRMLQAQVRSYRDWAMAKEKTKRGAVDKGYVGHRAAKLMKRMKVAQRRLEETVERMQTEKPRGIDRVVLDFSTHEGHRLLWALDLDVGYDAPAPLARGITFSLSAGDRLAILGPNGCGKTTVLRTVMGEVPPLAGQIRVVPSARIGYFDQEASRIPAGVAALEAALATGKDETLVRTVLGRMRIRRESVHKPVGSLSAGERAKVLLARLILGDHNLLILDEPTNFLDIETQDALLDALVNFPGGIVFVAHDRHFVDTLATQALALGAGTA